MLGNHLTSKGLPASAITVEQHRVRTLEQVRDQVAGALDQLPAFVGTDGRTAGLEVHVLLQGQQDLVRAHPDAVIAGELHELQPLLRRIPEQLNNVVRRRQEWRSGDGVVLLDLLDLLHLAEVLGVLNPNCGGDLDQIALQRGPSRVTRVDVPRPQRMQQLKSVATGLLLVAIPVEVGPQRKAGSAVAVVEGTSPNQHIAVTPSGFRGWKPSSQTSE